MGTLPADEFDLVVRNSQTLRASPVASYKGPFMSPGPTNNGYVTADVVKSSNGTLYISVTGTVMVPNTDPLTSANWCAFNELDFFEESLCTGVQEASVWAPKSAMVSVGIALIPKGFGALMADCPDSTATGGNARGQNAVDWQMSRVNASQVASGDYSTIGGGENNTAGDPMDATKTHQTVGGGLSNVASGNRATVGGGQFNVASGLRSTVGGGGGEALAQGNKALGFGSTVSGGTANSATFDYTSVGGGIQNNATDTSATVGGGTNNSANAVNSTVGGGDGNTASGSSSTVGGGNLNSATTDYASVGGGLQNSATNTSAAVGGGQNNTASGSSSAVGGGDRNTASGSGSNVGGGINNGASGSNSTIAGGAGNSALNSSATVGGGSNNAARSINSFVGGGTGNTASQTNATVGGGSGNSASGTGSTASGGISNTASGQNSAVGGGVNNSAGGTHSFCVGERCDAPTNHSTAVGKWNAFGNLTNGNTDGDRIFMVGFGTDAMNRGNLFSVTDDGYANALVGYEMGAADLAEWMESSETSKIPRGTSVVIENGKIRPALEGEIPFAVISTTPALIGNAAESHWHGKFEFDADGQIVMEEITQTREVPKTRSISRTRKVLEKKTIGGETFYQEVDKTETFQETVTQEIPVRDAVGKVIRTVTEPVMITETYTERRHKLSPLFDPNLRYVPRSQRPEWNLVGFLGQIPVRKGQPVNPKWQLLKPIDAEFDMYLVK